MKLKKILASVAAFAIAATAFSGVVMANSYGEPVLTATVDYPVDVDGDTYLTVTVGYTGFTGFAAYNKMKKTGVGLTSASVTLGYDDTKLDYVATMDGVFADGTAGGTIPSMNYAWAVANMKNQPESDEFMVAYFTVKDGVDFDTDSVTFTFDSYEFGVTNAPSTVELYGTTNACTAGMTAEDVTYGATTPTTEYVNVTTDGNVEGIADGQVEKGSKAAVSAKVVEGNTATLYANGVEIVDGAEYTFDADVSFTVEYTPIPPVAEYTYSIANAGYRPGKAADKEDVFYKLNISKIAEGAKALVATVAEKDFSVPLAAPVVEGAADVEFTYVFTGVPVSVFGTDTIVEKFTAFGTDNQAYVKADAQ